MGVQIRPVPEINDSDSTVSYVFQFQEGSIYRWETWKFAAWTVRPPTA